MSMTSIANATGISLGQAQAAAEALARVLPTGAPLTPLLAQGSEVREAARAVIASFVGSVSADLAVVLLEVPQLVDEGADGSPLVALQDVLQPALEAASDTLGAGVLDDARIDDASALFTDPATTVFALSGSGGVAGWFAVRGRFSRSSAEPSAGGVLGGKLARISNVEMALTVEIGRTRMAVRDVLAMEPGAVIELDRSAGSPADVLLNGRLIAHGEIVVVDQDYAVRITKILDTAEDLD
jgi:flagellar motor switch protein FliN/FliY